MNWELLRDLFINCRGRLWGSFFGLLFGILIVTWGFARALFVMFCLGCGYAIGSRIDADKGIKQLFERFFGEW